MVFICGSSDSLLYINSLIKYNTEDTAIHSRACIPPSIHIDFVSVAFSSGLIIITLRGTPSNDLPIVSISTKSGYS